MFAEQIMDLKDAFKGRMQLINVFSREFNDSEIFNGRIDAVKLQQLATAGLIPSDADHCFACGPESMLDAIETYLPKLGIASEKFILNALIRAHPRLCLVSRSNSAAKKPSILY